MGARVPLINFVHSTDEAADVIREVGVYFGAEARRAIYRGALAAPMDRDRVEALIAELQAAVPPHDLALEPAVRRLIRQLDAIGTRDVGWGSELHGHLVHALDGAPADWRSIARLVDELGLPYSRWDLIVIAAHVVRSETGIAKRLLPGAP